MRTIPFHPQTFEELYVAQTSAITSAVSKIESPIYSYLFLNDSSKGINSVAETWRRVWEEGKNDDDFSDKIPIFTAKISDDLFLVIDQVFRIFTDFRDLCFVKCRA